MKYSYLRVSTKDKQEFTRQEFVLKDYAVDKVFEEKISGTKKASNRPEFEKMLAEVKRGDIIYFESMSRMARSMQDLIDTTNLLSNKMGVQVVFVKENISVGGKGLDAMSALVFNIMGAFAQFERDLISDRTKQALSAKKEQGVTLGKPITKLDPATVSNIHTLYESGVDITNISRQLGLGRKIVKRVVEKGE